VEPTQRKIRKKIMKPSVDLLLTNAAEIITCVPTSDDLIGRISNGTIAVAGERILAIGTSAELEDEFDTSSAKVIDASGKIVAPGFVDCHTHLVFGKHRAKEYSDRMTLNKNQISQLEYPVGIQASVMMTRDASEDELYESAFARLNNMFAAGTTTVESKSGYGLCLKDELKQLLVNRRLNAAHSIDVISTFLGGHDFPPEVDRNDPSDRDSYLDTLIREMIPVVAEQQLAEFCDVYCDEGYFTVDETRQILEAGIAVGLRPKVHTDAYAGIGGSAMAAELHAISADHLNYVSKTEMRQLAKAGVVGVVLPALDFAVDHPKPFEARPMMDEGMTLALATNLNPGNWTESMQFVMMLACRRHRMSPEEAMLAATWGAAKALGREAEIGSLQKDKLADIQIWNLPAFEHVIYRLGINAVETVIKCGNVCYVK